MSVLLEEVVEGEGNEVGHGGATLFHGRSCSSRARVAEFFGCPSQPADDLGVLGVAELAAPGGEAVGSERVHSVGIGQPKPPEQLAPAVRPFGGEGFSFHLNVAVILQ